MQRSTIANWKPDQPNTDFQADDLTKKLILLFIFEKMEIPLTEQSLSETIVINPTWLSYIDFREVLYQLNENRFVNRARNGNDLLYHLTPQGRGALSHFYTQIPASIREEITEYAKENRNRLKRSQEYVYDYYKNTDGTYMLLLRIKEQSTENLLEIRLKTDTRANAIKAASKWKEKAPLVYEAILHTLMDDN